MIDHELELIQTLFDIYYTYKQDDDHCIVKDLSLYLSIYVMRKNRRNPILLLVCKQSDR